jgi:hypothetical protein
MAGKRKRTYRRSSYRRPYRRRRYSNTSLLRKVMDENTRLKMFGPSAGQTLAHAMKTGALVTKTPEQAAARRALKYYGDGDYWSDLGTKVRSSVRSFIPKDVGHWGSRIGGALLGGGAAVEGGPLGMLAGATAGWDEGAKASKWFGWGDYTNQIMNGTSDPSAPVILNSTDLSGDVYISQREFVGNIVVNSPTSAGGGTSSFELREFDINPGLKNTFPFLSQIAQNFEMYELQGCIFQFKSTYGESVSGANNLGKVIMATNYDPSAPIFHDTVRMQNYDYSNACRPSDSMLHGVETASSKRATDMLYVRSSEETRDKIFSDIGKFQVATEGVPLQTGATSSIIGELWVSYRVKLSRSKLRDTSLGGATDSIHLNLSDDVTQGWTENLTVTESTHSSKRITIKALSGSYLRIRIEGVNTNSTYKINMITNIVEDATAALSPLRLISGHTSNKGYHILENSHGTDVIVDGVTGNQYKALIAVGERTGVNGFFFKPTETTVDIVVQLSNVASYNSANCLIEIDHETPHIETLNKHGQVTLDHSFLS